MKLMLNGKEVSGMGHYVMAGDIKDATAEDSNVLSGKSYYNNNGKREGTMPNRGGMSAELAAGGSVSILEGYHNGEGVVRAQDLASQTPGTAAAANIEAGYTAWVNGALLTGIMAKGKQVQIGTIEGRNLDNSRSISTPTLPFVPEGAFFCGVQTRSYNYVSEGSICAGIATADYKTMVIDSSSGTWYDYSEVTRTIDKTNKTVTLKHSSKYFNKNQDFLYVAWGE